MPPKVIRKVRTPEGQKRYGQPIGTIITKDMQAAAAFRFMYTPFTVQYYLGVLSYNQLVKQGKKYSPPLPGKPVGTKEHPAIPIPADFTLVTPAITEKAGLAGLWGFAQGPDGKVYRWDRMPDSSIVLRGVPLSSLKPEQKAQFPKPLVQADPKIDPRTKMQVHAWLDTTKMPDVPEAVSKTTQEMMDNTTIPQAEGDEAPSPTPKVKPEPSARWEKVEGTTLKAVQKYLAKEGKQAASPVYRLYLDKQSVGLVVKVTFNDGSSGWRLYQNGANISSASTKAGLLKIAVDNWMMGLLLPDGKANLPDSTQEAEEFGVDTGALPSPDSGLPEGTSGTEALTAEELLAGFDADDPDEQVSIPSDEMKVVLGTIKKVHQSKPSTPAGATVLAQQMDLITPEQASDALDWMKAHPEDFANIAPYDVAIPDYEPQPVTEEISLIDAATMLKEEGKSLAGDIASASFESLSIEVQELLVKTRGVFEENLGYEGTEQSLLGEVWDGQNQETFYAAGEWLSSHGIEEVPTPKQYVTADADTKSHPLPTHEMIKDLYELGDLPEPFTGYDDVGQLLWHSDSSLTDVLSDPFAIWAVAPDGNILGFIVNGSDQIINFSPNTADNKYTAQEWMDEAFGFWTGEATGYTPTFVSTPHLIAALIEKTNPAIYNSPEKSEDLAALQEKLGKPVVKPDPKATFLKDLKALPPQMRDLADKEAKAKNAWKGLSWWAKALVARSILKNESVVEAAGLMVVTPKAKDEAEQWMEAYGDVPDYDESLSLKFLLEDVFSGLPKQVRDWYAAYKAKDNLPDLSEDDKSWSDFWIHNFGEQNIPDQKPPSFKAGGMDVPLDATVVWDSTSQQVLGWAMDEVTGPKIHTPNGQTLNLYPWSETQTGSGAELKFYPGKEFAAAGVLGAGFPNFAQASLAALSPKAQDVLVQARKTYIVDALDDPDDGPGLLEAAAEDVGVYPGDGPLLEAKAWADQFLFNRFEPTWVIVVPPDVNDTPDIPPAEASEGSKPPLTDADLQQYGIMPFAGFNPDADLTTLDPAVKLSVMLGVRQWVDTKGMTNPTTGGDLNLFMAMMGESIAKVQAALIPDEPENWKDLAKRAALTYLTVKPLSSVDIGSTQGLGWYGQLPPEVRSAISDIHIALGELGLLLPALTWEDLASVAPHLAATKEAQAAKILWWDRGYDFGDDVVAAVDYNEGVLVPDPAFGKPPVSGQFGKLPKGVMVLNGAQPISDFYSQLDSKLIGDESVEFDDLVADTGMQVMYAAMVQYAQDPQFWKQLAVDQWNPTNEHDRRVLGLVMAVHYVSQALFEDVGFSGAPGPVIAFMEEHYIEDVPDYDQPEKALQHVANDASGSNFMQNFEKSWLEGSVYTGSSTDEELESERRFLRMIGLDPDNPGKRLDAPEEIAKSLVAPKQPKSWDDVPATERKFNFTDEQREKIAYDLGVDNPTLVLSTGKVTDNGYIEVWALGNQVSYRNFVNADGQFKWDDWEPDNNGYYMLQGVPAWKDDAAGFETWKNHAYLAFMEAGGAPELPYDVGGVNSLTDPTTVTVNGQTLHFEIAQFYPETVDLTIYPGQQIWEAGDVPAYLYDPVADAYFEVSGEPLEVKDLAQGKQVRVAKIPQDMALTAHNLPTGQLSVPKGSGGPEPVYALPGGLYASKKDIQEAIKTLKASKGIMVKQPLEKAGSPLAAMDYHAIAEPHKSKYEGDADKTKHALLDALEEIITKDPTESGYSGKEMSKQWAKEAAKVPGVTGVSKPPTEPRLQVHFNADTHGAWSFQKDEATFSLPTNAILVYASGGEYASAYTDEVIPAWRRGLIGFWTVKDGKPDKFHGLEVGTGTGKSPLGDTHEQLAPDSPNSYGANSYKYVGVPTLVLTQGKWTSDYGLSSLDEAIGYSEQQGEQAGMSEPASSGPEMVSVSVDLDPGHGKSLSVEVPVTAVLVYNNSSESGKPFGWVDTTEAVPGNAMMLHYFDGDGITTMDFGEWFTSYVAPGMSFNTASGDKDGVPNSKGYVGFGAVLASLGNFDLLPYASKMILTNAVEYKANHPDADISQSLAMGYETAKMTDAVSGVPDLAFGYEIAKKWMDVNGLHTTTSAKQVEQIEVEWGWAAPEGSTVPKNSVLVILKDYLKGGSPGVMGWVDPADPDTLWYPTMDAGVTGSLPLKQYLGDVSDIKDKVRFVKAEVYADNPANGGALTLESALKVEVGKAISKDLPPNVTLTDAGEFQVTFDGHTMEIPADALIVMNGKKIVGYERIDADGHIYAYRSYSSKGWMDEKPSQLDGIADFPSKGNWGWEKNTHFPVTSLIGQSQPLDHNFDPTGLEVSPLKGSVLITYPPFKKTVGGSTGKPEVGSQPESSPDLVETIEATKKIQFIESDAQNALNMVKDGWTGSWTDWHPTNYNADFDELSIGAQAVLFGMVRDLMDNAAAVVSMSPSDARQTLVEWAQAHDDDLHAVYGYSSALPAVFGWLVNHNLTQVPSWGDPKGQAALMASDAEGTEWGSLLAKYVLGKPIPNTGGNVEGYTTKILKILGLNPDVPGAAPSWGKKKAGSKAKKPKKVGPVPPHVTGDAASLKPFHPPAAGRWGKKGSKGYVDVYSDGSGVYVSPAGKKTTLDAAKVRDRIAKGLTLQVPAEPLPYRGVPGATYRLLTIDGKQVLVEGNGPNGVKGIKYTAFKILPDGSVEARNDQDTTVPSEILTPQEFADLAFSDTYQNAGMLVANLGKANNIPLFKDEEQAKAWADANGGYPLAGGYYSNPDQLIPNDSGYIEALEGSLYDFSFWISKWNQEHNYSQKITGMGLSIPIAEGQYDSPGASVRRLYYTLRRAYGIDPDKDMYTPVREGSYDEVGPFYVNKDTKGVWAPRGIVSQTVYSTLDVDQSAKELTDWMTGLVTDMGLSGILFPKKSMYVKGQKQAWILAFRAGDFAKIKEMEKQNGNENPALDGLPDKVYWEARIPTEIPAGMPIGQWSSAPVFNSMPDDKATPEIDNYLLAAKCAHPEYLSYSERKAWVINHLQGNARLIRVLSQRAEQRIRKGDDPHTPEPVYTPGVTPQSLWEPHVKSILQADLSSVTWSLQESIYEEFYKDEMAGKTLSQVMKAYPHHAEFWRSLLSQAANVPLAQVASTSAFPEKKSSFYFKSMFDNAKKAENLAKAEASKIPVLHIPASKLDLPLEKGTHPCFVVEDQNGDPWFFKQMPEKFRVDVEVMANELAHAVGYDLIPEVMPVTGDKGQPPHQMGGKIGFAQRYQPNLGTIKGKKVSSLTLTQQTDIALDHVLDWFIDNDDGHKDNFLITEDGHLVPIDKGRAMKHWGVWDGLAGNTSANHNASLASTELFEAIKKHEISEKDAQAIYKAVMQQAAKIQGTPWAPLEDIIRQGQARRTQWYPSHTPQNVDDLVEKVKFRHDHMTDDMEAVWSKVLAQAGYEKPPTPKPPVHDMYESVDTQFAVNLDETRTLGQSLMVASPTWEEGHLLFWTDTQKQERVSHGQGYLIGPKKKKLYTDLHDAAGGSKSPQTPEDSHAQEVDSQLHDLITAQHNTWRKMAQNHSKTVMGESETPVTVEEAETQYAQSVEQWKAMRASWEAEYGEDINPAYLDALEAQAYYWYESMRKELTDAIQEKRKSVRPRFNKPNLPVTNQPGSDWEQQWRITKDHHESTTVYKTGEETAYEMPVPQKMVLFAAKPESKEKAETIFEKRFPELAKMGVTLTVEKMQGPDGELHHRTLDMESDYMTSSGYGSGYEYVLTLPTGEKVRVAGPSSLITAGAEQSTSAFGPLLKGTSNLMSMGGLVRWDGNPGQDVQEMWEHVRPVVDALEPVVDVTDQDLQLMYWRMMCGTYQTHAMIPADRLALNEAVAAKAKELGAPANLFGQVESESHGKPNRGGMLTTFPTDILAQAGMSPEDELAFWQELFTPVVGEQMMQQFLANEGWRPRFEHDIKSGLPFMHPYWQRADIDYMALQDHWLIHNGMDLRHMVWTPLICTDERVRAVHQYWNSGQSSGPDQASGAGGVVYTRDRHGVAPTGQGLIISPIVYGRIGVYSAPYDAWGHPEKRMHNSPLMPEDMFWYSGNHDTPAHEVCVKWQIGMDNVYAIGETYGEAEFQTWMKKYGITEMGGKPVDEIVGKGHAGKHRKEEFEQIKKSLESGGWI
jgi:hypothetical protein